MTHAGDQCEIVAGNEHSGAEAVDVFEYTHDFSRQTRVEVAGRFVSQE